MKNLVVLSGAGISAGSGIQTFRDANGLWEGYDVMQVASKEGFINNPELVLQFYNQRRKQLLQAQPNEAHFIIAKLEELFNLTIITQNVDDLHERAGSKKIIHLHGELLKARSTVNENLVYEWREDINYGTKNIENHQLRPHIVWFGEDVPNIIKALPIIQKADIILVIGTSLQVYPAAGLISYAKKHADIYYIDINPVDISSFNTNIKVIKEDAATGLSKIFEELNNL